MHVLVTAAEIIARIGEIEPIFTSNGIVAVAPKLDPVSDGADVMNRLEHIDGWIFENEKISKEVLEAGVQRGLRAAIKWGRGLDNVDLGSARSMALFITDSPEGPSDDFQEKVRRVALQLVRRFDLKVMIQKGATRALHEGFCQFEI